MAMVRHRAAVGSNVPTRLLYSSRTPDDLIYGAELDRLQAADNGLEVFHTFTREQPPGWTGYARRIDRAMLSEVSGPLQARSNGAGLQAFICGPTLLVESVANGLVQAGIPPRQVRTERFGPTS
jgi:ferredoxin-NADP reductase